MDLPGLIEVEGIQEMVYATHINVALVFISCPIDLVEISHHDPFDTGSRFVHKEHGKKNHLS